MNGLLFWLKVAFTTSICFNFAFHALGHMLDMACFISFSCFGSGPHMFKGMTAHGILHTSALEHSGFSTRSHFHFALPGIPGRHGSGDDLATVYGCLVVLDFPASPSDLQSLSC